MNNQNILLVITLGCFSVLLSGLLVLILGFELNIQTVYFSILVGALTSILVGFTIKLRLQRINNQLKLSQLLLNESETIIIDGKAEYNSTIGRLYLTDQRVVFLPKTTAKEEVTQKVLFLDNIASVKKFMTAGLISKGIIILDAATEHSFIIDFANDWCRLVDWQLLLSKSREKDFNSHLINHID